MTDARSRRQAALRQLLRKSRLSRQDALAIELRSLGHEVTQATVSRDLDQLGAIKLRRDGETFYALPDALIAKAPEQQFDRLFGEWVRSVTAAASLVVLKTPPGSAHLVGVALDSADLTEVAGTICGDDTIFVACRSPNDAQTLAATWSEWLGG